MLGFGTVLAARAGLFRRVFGGGTVLARFLTVFPDLERHVDCWVRAAASGLFFLGEIRGIRIRHSHRLRSPQMLAPRGVTLCDSP